MKPSHSNFKGGSMKVTVVGTGMVGSSFAYRMLVSGLSDELVHIDVNHDRALGEAEDMEHALALELPGIVYAGEYADARGSDFVVITAGLSKMGEDGRLGLAKKNAEIVRDIIKQVSAVAPDAFYIVATNPMDVMTYATIKYSGLAPRQVIGSGTVLDSARFRALLSEKLQISASQISAFSLGEHGDNQVPIYSQVKVKGIALESMLHQMNLSFEQDERDAMTEKIKTAAYRIIERKGATYYGIASSLTRIIRAIHRDERVILPVSVMPQGEYGLDDVCLALPSLVTATGVERIFDLSLTQQEYEALMASAAVLREYNQQLPQQ
jgi:L-lactate dehydrogenase